MLEAGCRLSLTRILDAVAKSEEGASDELFALVYDELRRLAMSQLSDERPGHTLQPTALVHEAYLRLAGLSAGQVETTGGKIQWQGRAHFFFAAARAMRQILIEAARRKARQKHGGEMNRVPLDPENVSVPVVAEDLLALHEALEKLAGVDAQVAELIHLRYFAGLTVPEAAAALGISPRTADSYWAYGRAWLHAEIGSGHPQVKES